ncbi:LysM peptidoglycan-binding domain-containing protein [Modestobacter roseus]|uniref:LysM domain-containing protein n=1 Tax=Modestobacter roseus TaxID=1181884 RepID=A0A562IS39_9ACTN|nr:LysM peptidoglycan-binding domain-containing protein [Modestobacter roseus]TWH73758.1 LysM domain-containing protein [Modestobacter roseus]
MVTAESPDARVTRSRPPLRLVTSPVVEEVSAGRAGSGAVRRPSARPGGRPVAGSGVASTRTVRGGGCRTVPTGPPSRVGERDELPMRLTRRGRRVVAALSIAVGLGVAAGTLAVAGDGGPALRLAAAGTVVVQPGDTLWSIAGEVAPDEDRRAVVDALLERNDLDDVVLQPGQVLELP